MSVSPTAVGAGLPSVAPAGSNGATHPDGAAAPRSDAAGQAAPFAAALTIALGRGATGGRAATGTASETGTQGAVLADESAAEGDSAYRAGVDPAGGVSIDAVASGETPLASADPASVSPSAMPVAAMPVPAMPAEAPAAVHRALDLLVPDFRQRLERVIERMESEFGCRVTVVETYRSQSRQDALFAQGRSQDGPVVTWTRDSNHTGGRAADLVIDGSYDNPLAYERLMRVAQAEGLRTLGARDPGHVELPRAAHGAAGLAPARPPSIGIAAGLPDRLPGGVPPDSPHAAIIGRVPPSVASPASLVRQYGKLERRERDTRHAGAAGTAAPSNDPASATGPAAASVAGVARVASVAAVAAPATVAPVAAVAAAATVAPVATVASTAPVVAAAPRRGAASMRTETVAEPSTDRELSSLPDGSREDGPASRDVAERAALGSTLLRELDAGLLNAAPNTGGSGSAGERFVSASAGVSQTDMSERIARYLEVQDTAAERPLSQVLLRLERPDGGEDRIRVDLRGTAVSATLDVSDRSAADRMRLNMSELQRALERHGLDAEALNVRASAQSSESSALTRAAVASAESDLQRATSSAAAGNTSSRDRGARPDDERSAPDSHRHRSRREQKGER